MRVETTMSFDQYEFEFSLSATQREDGDGIYYPYLKITGNMTEDFVAIAMGNSGDSWSIDDDEEE